MTQSEMKITPKVIADESGPDEFDANMAKPLKTKAYDKPFKMFGLALVEGKYFAVSVHVDSNGKVSQWKTHYHPEVELEFAQDTLKKVLAQEGVRY